MADILKQLQEQSHALSALALQPDPKCSGCKGAGIRLSFQNAQLIDGKQPFRAKIGKSAGPPLRIELCPCIRIVIRLSRE